MSKNRDLAENLREALVDTVTTDSESPTVVDSLISTSTTEPLSANQGKVLQDTKIEPDNYATSTVGGTVKARYDGGTSTLYITIDGTTA